MLEGVQIGSGSGCVVLSPELDVIVRRCQIESIESRGKRPTLVSDQCEQRSPTPGQQGELEEELDSHVPDVVHRPAEPQVQQAATGSSDSVNRSLWTGVSFLSGHRFGAAGCDETIQCSINERASNRPNPTDVAVCG